VNRIYLASKSPRRQELLGQLGIAFEPLWPWAEESEAAEALENRLPGETPVQYVQRVALAKLQAACERRLARDLPPLPILTADTTVALGNMILGKPADANEACAMLQALSGKTHKVLTAVAIARPEGWQPKVILSRSRVLFARLSVTQIRDYVATGEPMDKAGAYAYQGGAARFIRKIEGSASGIIGLPLYETAQLLKP
jgi:septum formation protein